MSLNSIFHVHNKQLAEIDLVKEINEAKRWKVDLVFVFNTIKSLYIVVGMPIVMKAICIESLTLPKSWLVILGWILTAHKYGYRSTFELPHTRNCCCFFQPDLPPSSRKISLIKNRNSYPIPASNFNYRQITSWAPPITKRCVEKYVPCELRIFWNTE